MKTFRILILIFLFVAKQSYAQNPENWTAEQLMDPAKLAKRLQTGKNVPMILCVGPGALIPNSIDIGPAKEKDNLEKLTSSLKSLSRDTAIVVYCGCCPFEQCPNVRPAIALLKELHFTNYKLLNLPHNLKADWLDKGYPAVKQ
jgi:hypothetical protein